MFRAIAVAAGVIFLITVGNKVNMRRWVFGYLGLALNVITF
jgi:hypothetical protein